MSFALNSVIQILEEDQNHLDLDGCKGRIEFFLDKARSLRDLFPTNTTMLPTDMDIRIRDLAYKAANAIEPYISLNILLPHYKFTVEKKVDLQTLRQGFESTLDYLVEDIESIKEEITADPSGILSLKFLAPRLPTESADPKNGFIREEDFQVLKARVLGGLSNQLQIIPVQGIAGIGKTTLTRRLYNDDSVSGGHFDIRVWIASPQKNNVKSHLVRILEGLGKTAKELAGKDVDHLGSEVQNALNYRKYFIVIQNVKFIETWNKVKRFFPKDSKGSRIILIISHCKVGNRLGDIETEKQVSSFGNAEPHKLDVLGPNESWALFCHEVFGQDQHCPDDLLPSGEHIVRMCRGIPLLISLIGGLLVTVSKEVGFWDSVDAMLGEHSESSDTDIYAVVSQFIYCSLPYYLRPCFLYVGNYPVSHDIQASQVVKLWLAEGFMEKRGDACQEDLAEDYLKMLAHRNLINPIREGHKGKIKAFQVHQVLQKFCSEIACHMNFLQAMPICDDDNDSSSEEYPLIMHPYVEHSEGKELQLFGRSLLTFERPLQDMRWEAYRPGWLRVLEVLRFGIYQFPERPVMEFLLLRYLALSCHQNVPVSICNLRNLQTLIFRRISSFRAIALPSELREMARLRHIDCKGTFIWRNLGKDDRVAQWKLQTLSNMQVFGITSEFLDNIPDVRKLGIFGNVKMQTDLDLARLLKLETLKCTSDWSLASRNFLSHLTFPTSLLKLTLRMCRIPCNVLNVVGLLPKLEQLKLQKCDFLGIDGSCGKTVQPAWEPTEGGFLALISLVMVDLNLVHWRARAAHFPRLCKLIIRDCCEILEIPLDIGNIASLKFIEANKKSTPSLIASAKQIGDAPRVRGGTCLKVHITGAY